LAYTSEHISDWPIILCCRRATGFEKQV
jgi:hypothetical protein